MASLTVTTASLRVSAARSGTRDSPSRRSTRPDPRARFSFLLRSRRRRASPPTAPRTLVSDHARRLGASAARRTPARIPARRSQRWTVVRAAEDAEKAKDEEDTPEARVEGAGRFAAAGYPSERRRHRSCLAPRR